MFVLKYSSRFKKDLKVYKHDKDVLIELQKVLDALIGGIGMPLKNGDHRLTGELKDCFECHVKPDVLLIYKKEKSEIAILRIGSHSELF